MATNPNNAIGTNGAYGGRTSVNAFNDDLAIYSGRGIISGWACAPSSGLTVVLGGSGTIRDVAVAQDNAGNRTTINNISGAPVSVTLSGAPTANSRIDAIVAYVDNPPQGSSTIADNYQACGIIAVAGTPAASPSAPAESAIRSAITADGASGATAYYVVLATVVVATGTTTIVAGNITDGAIAQVRSENIKMLAPSSTILQTLNITSTQTMTIQHDGFLVGRALMYGENASGIACVKSGNTATDIFLGGIPYSTLTGIQVAFTIPVKVGQVLNFVLENNGSFADLYILAAQ